MEPRRPTFGSFGRGAPVPRDLIVLIGVLFLTFTWQFFATTEGLHRMMVLSPEVWQRLFVWKIATYGLMGSGPASFWFVVSLIILFWFGRDVFWRLGRRRFWTLVVWAVLGAGVVGTVVHFIATFIPGGVGRYPFALLPGQAVMWYIMVAAFATLFSEATILLFFVLPIKAKWFLPLEIVLVFVNYLGSRDLAGFAGILAAVAITYTLLKPGGLRRLAREGRLRVQAWWYRQKLDRERRKRKLKVVKGGGGNGPSGGPWVHRNLLRSD